MAISNEFYKSLNGTVWVLEAEGRRDVDPDLYNVQNALVGSK